MCGEFLGIESAWALKDEAKRAKRRPDATYFPMRSLLHSQFTKSHHLSRAPINRVGRNTAREGMTM
jgi:hypothetical protein